MMDGWIRLHRRLQDNRLWKKEPFTAGQAWVDLLLMAEWKDGMTEVRGIRIALKRGQLGMPEQQIAKRWTWSRGKVRRFERFLVQENMILIEQYKNKVTTIITICNYDEYQGYGTSDSTSDDTIDSTSDKQISPENGTSDPQKRYNSIDNKNKNKNKTIKVFDSEFEKVFNEFKEMRKKMRKPMTGFAEELIMQKLVKLSNNDESIKIKILKQSIVNSWQGVFPLKQKQSGKLAL